MICGFTLASLGEIASSAAAATQKGRNFLVALLDAELGLLPEYREATVYWLFHDNYLAAKVLKASHPEIAQTIRSAIEREGIRKSGKIEMLFGEAEKPLPFRQYQLTDVRRAGTKIIRTEVVTGTAFDGWRQYADLLLLACIADKDPAAARQHWNDAMALWDGKGFLDAAAKHSRLYATYKLALALIAANRLSPAVKPPDGLPEKLLSLQSESGGWITDYDAAGKTIGVANVETTCLAILGLEAHSRVGAQSTR
jgi:hypothetical protein